MLKQKPTIASKINSHLYKHSPTKIGLISPNTIQSNKQSSSSPSIRNIKIKLVSPLKNTINTDRTKQNYTFSQNSTRNHSPIKPSIYSNSPFKQSEFSSNFNDSSNISIKQHFQPNFKTYQHQSPPKKYQSFILMKQNTSSKKIVSPNKVSINNKSFDIGSLKSQIIYVAPFQHIHQPNKPSLKTQNCPFQNQTSILWRKQMIIQQQNQAQQSKQSTHRSNLNQIEQLKQQLNQSSKKIKQILNNTNKDNQSICISEFVYTPVKSDIKKTQIKTNRIQLEDIPLEYSRLQTQNKIIVPTHNTEKTLINDLSFQTNQRLSIQREEICIQTDFKKSQKNKIIFKIFHSFSYQIFPQINLQPFPFITQLNSQQPILKPNSQFQNVQTQQFNQSYSIACHLTINQQKNEPNPLVLSPNLKDISYNTSQTHQLCFNQQEALQNIQFQNGINQIYGDSIVNSNEQSNHQQSFSKKINNSIYLL